MSVLPWWWCAHRLGVWLGLAAFAGSCAGAAASSGPSSVSEAAPIASPTSMATNVASATNPAADRRPGPDAPGDPGLEPAAPRASAPIDELGPGSTSTSAATSAATEVSGTAACPTTVPAGTACVPGGAFVRGSDDGPENERPAATVFVSTFLMDTHEVDNAHYRECVGAGECARLTSFPGYMGDTQPAVGMRWADADAYCRRLGARLPTEAEWERAASGPDDAVFPWGASGERPCERAVVRVREGRGCGRDTTWPVGSLAPNAWGLHDMAGNVWEWVADHFSWCYRGCARACGDACEAPNPAGMCGDPHADCPAALGHRTVRGGSWWYGVDRATTSSRRGAPGMNPNPHRFGFRCARDVPVSEVEASYE